MKCINPKIKKGKSITLIYSFLKSDCMNPKVDWYFNKPSKWQESYRELRHIILECGLQEELKWGVPCYTFNGNNVLLIHGFKDYCAVLFHKGALLKDKNKILVQQTKNVQAARQIRFSNVEEIVTSHKMLLTYIKDAIAMEKSGLKVEMKETKEFEMPDEFKEALKEIPGLKKSFYSLTPGRQRGYLLYFSQAKQTKTREARIEKYADKILDGKGLED